MYDVNSKHAEDFINHEEENYYGKDQKAYS